MLLFHIITAIATLASAILAVSHQARWKYTFRLLTILSLSSGVGLALTTTGLTAHVCARLGIYLLMIIITEYKLRKMSRPALHKRDLHV
jgi:hypothetical protein